MIDLITLNLFSNCFLICICRLSIYKLDINGVFLHELIKIMEGTVSEETLFMPIFSTDLFKSEDSSSKCSMKFSLLSNFSFSFFFLILNSFSSVLLTSVCKSHFPSQIGFHTLFSTYRSIPKSKL